MDDKILRGLLLLALISVLAGCATASPSADDSTPDLQPVPTNDDSHGWGANLQNVSR